MEDFSKKSIWGHNIPEEDKGVYVSEVIELAKRNKFYDELADLLEVEKINEDFIEIKGASLLVNSLKNTDRKFIKFDFGSDYYDIDYFFGDDNHFYISFLNIEDEDVKQLVGGNEFTCRTEYSSKIDFYKNTFSIQSFAGELIDAGYSTFVKHTLNSIKNLIKRGDNFYIYRILKDNEGVFYLRAIVSKRYNDYNDNITVFLGLIGLHYEMKKTNQKFSIQKVEYNESFVRVSFVKDQDRVIEGIGQMKYVIEVSNDEVKREALKFIGAVTLYYDDNKGNKGELYIKPSKLKSKILSISHGSTPETAIAKLGDLENYVGKEEDMYNLIVGINDIKDPNAVRHLIYNRIKNTNKSEISANRNAILAELNSTIDNMHQLFSSLNKIDHITQDIEAKEYLRFLFFDALIYRKLDKDDSNDEDQDE